MESELTLPSDLSVALLLSSVCTDVLLRVGTEPRHVLFFKLYVCFVFSEDIVNAYPREGRGPAILIKETPLSVTFLQ